MPYYNNLKYNMQIQIPYITSREVFEIVVKPYSGFCVGYLICQSKILLKCLCDLYCKIHYKLGKKQDFKFYIFTYILKIISFNYFNFVL